MHQYFLSFSLIFLSYIIINKYICGYSFNHHSEYKQDAILANILKYLYFHPRIHGTMILNTTYAIINNAIQSFYRNSTNKERIQLFAHRYYPTIIGSTNPFGIYTIHNDINYSIFYFHKAKDLDETINFSSITSIRKSKKKNIIQNKKIIKNVYYHNNTKPLIIICKIDTNPVSPSTYDSTIHTFAILEAIKYIFSSKKTLDKIKHDFAFVFTGCEEFDQLGTKYLIKNVFNNGGYYLFLSGFGVDRPFTLYSQSNKSSSVLKALSKVRNLPIASFTSELEDLISIIKSKSISTTKFKETDYTNFDYRTKSKILEEKTKPNANLKAYKKLKKLKENNRYKFRYRTVNSATQFQKSDKFSGAELSFIGNSLLHSTSNDIDNDEHNMMNIQLVTHCILNFLTNFETKKDDLDEEKHSIAFGLSPFVFLIEKEKLNFFSSFLICFFLIYLSFYLFARVLYNFVYLKTINKTNKASLIDVFYSVFLVFSDEFSFIFYYFLALISTFVCFFVLILLLSVVNPSSMISNPNLYLFLFVFSIFSVFIVIFNCFRKSKNENNPNFNLYLVDDWHFLQVFYITFLLLIFKKFDFEILIVETAVFFIVLQFCPVHKNKKWLPLFLSFIILLPTIFTYSLLYRPYSIECQNLPVFFADSVPFIFIFVFFIHMSVFILPFYFINENKNYTVKEEKDQTELVKIHYLCSISQFYIMIKSAKKMGIEKVKEDDRKSNIDDKEKANLNKTSSNSNLNNNDGLVQNLKEKIERLISPKVVIFLNFCFFLFFFFKSPSFCKEIPIKGTFSHYFTQNEESSEISFIPKSGKRTASFILSALSKSASEMKYVYDFNGRLLTDPSPAFVKTVENMTLPFFFKKWPKISHSSIQYEKPKKTFFNDDEDDKSEEEKLKPKMVRQISININGIGPNVDFIYFIFKCNSNLRYGQCVDKRIKLIDPIDYSTIPYNNKNEERLLKPYLSKEGLTVFRIGSLVGYPLTIRMPRIEINVTENSNIKMTVAYQCFIETKEMKDFISKFNKFAVNEINQNEITQSVFIQTRDI